MKMTVLVPGPVDPEDQLFSQLDGDHIGAIGELIEQDGPGSATGTRREHLGQF